jgi:DNA-binding LacI/PurR family transcriptional regulator
MTRTNQESINKKSPLPVYYQIRNLLISEILTNLSVGDKFPSEEKLCSMYKVSRSTVRLALEHFIREGVIEKYKGKGTFVIKKIDVVPAAGLGQSQVPGINLILPWALLPGIASTIIHTSERQAFANDYQFVLFNSENNFDNVQKHIDKILQKKSVSGIILFTLYETGNTRGKNIELLEILKTNGVPLVIIDNLPLNGYTIDQFKTLGYDFVIPDNIQGGYLATKHLIELGHTNIAYIGTDTNAGKLRLEGYNKALTEAGININGNLIYQCSDFYVMEKETRNLLPVLLDKGITSVFVEEDSLAYKVIDYLRELGKRVPEDVSVVGHDDLDISHSSVPQLTTVKQPVTQEIELATKILFNKIENKPAGITQEILPVELVIRNSTKNRGE